MTKNKLLLLCASLCLGVSLMAATTIEATAQTPRREIRTANPKSPSVDSLLQAEHPLFADRVELKKRLSEEKKLREAELRAELESEALEFPSIDLYGENSWSRRLNPFTSGEATIPDSYTIDLGEFVMPLDTRRVTSHYGYRRRYRRHHYGTDFGLTRGDTIRSSFSGKVRVSSYNRGGFGNYIIVRHPNGLETVYGHLSRSLVKEGMIVKAGQPIGLGGNTGRSSGPHLHFETRFLGVAIDPELLFDFAEGAPRSDSYTFVKEQHIGGARYAARSAKVRSKGKGVSALASTATQVYRIRKGDTLYGIAQAHGVSLANLLSVNGMNSRTKLIPGRSVRIPD